MSTVLLECIANISQYVPVVHVLLRNSHKLIIQGSEAEANMYKIPNDNRKM